MSSAACNINKYLSAEIPFTNLFNSYSKLILEIINSQGDYPSESRINDISKTFFGKKVSKVGVEEYIIRLHKYFKFEQGTFIIAMIYLDRICTKAGISLCLGNIHRLLLISLTTAIKYNEDLHYSNEIFSKVGGVNLDNFNFLEEVFIKETRYELYVNEMVFKEYYFRLQKLCNI